MIRLGRPSLDEREAEAIAQVLRTGNLVQGSAVERFERAIVQKVDPSASLQAIAVSSGTAALHLALLAAGVGPGDTVVLPAYSFVASANVVELCGATPAFVDIDASDFTMDVGSLDDTLGRLTDRRARVAAIMPVHAFGQLTDMERLGSVARAIPIIEDAACAIGGARDGRAAGTWGLAGCFSFHPRKVITTGEGGAIVTADPALAAHLRALRDHGLERGASLEHVLAGFNYRMTDLQAAMGTVQLARLDELVARRREIASRYDAACTTLGLGRQTIRPDGIPQSYVALLPEELAGRRDAFIAGMRAREVEVSTGTWHMPLTRFFAERYGHRPGDFPVADSVDRRAVALPMHAELSDDDLARVIDALTGELARPERDGGGRAGAQAGTLERTR